MDAALGLVPERKQSDVQEEATRLAMEMPYGDAEAFLARLTDARLSDGAIHEVVDQLGGSPDVLDVAPSREAIQERIEHLQRMQPVCEEAAQAITAAVRYLTEHLSRVEYGSHRKGGYPIGSGAIESAHRFVAQVRLKRSGAWWYEASGNHMLALRCAKYNGTLEAIFERHAQARLTQ